ERHPRRGFHVRRTRERALRREAPTRQRLDPVGRVQPRRLPQVPGGDVISFSAFVITAVLALWAECIVWYFKRRHHDPRRVTMTVQQLAATVVVLGFVCPYIAAIRALIWGIRNGWEWIAQPVSMHAKARVARRRQISRARRSSVGAAVVQQLPAARPVLALPAAPAAPAA